MVIWLCLHGELYVGMDGLDGWGSSSVLWFHGDKSWMCHPSNRTTLWAWRPPYWLPSPKSLPWRSWQWQMTAVSQWQLHLSVHRTPATLLQSGPLSTLFFSMLVISPSRWCSMDLWNVGVLPQCYTVSQPRRPWLALLHICHLENKCYLTWLLLSPQRYTFHSSLCYS
jgi:hypothetical protein